MGNTSKGMSSRCATASPAPSPPREEPHGEAGEAGRARRGGGAGNDTAEPLAGGLAV